MPVPANSLYWLVSCAHPSLPIFFVCPSSYLSIFLSVHLSVCLFVHVYLTRSYFEWRNQQTMDWVLSPSYTINTGGHLNIYTDNFLFQLRSHLFLVALYPLHCTVFCISLILTLPRRRCSVLRYVLHPTVERRTQLERIPWPWLPLLDIIYPGRKNTEHTYEVIHISYTVTGFMQRDSDSHLYLSVAMLTCTWI